MQVTRELLRSRISGFAPLELPAFGRTEAAVLIPVIEYEEELHVLLTRRSPTLSKHAGEVSFPGGRVDADDETPYDAALREGAEEVGLEPSSCTLVGRLDDGVTVTGYKIATYVVFVGRDFRPALQEAEVEGTLLVPISLFLRPAGSFTVRVEGGALRLQFPLYVHEGTVIWGATARILANFASVLRGECGADEGKDPLEEAARKLVPMLLKARKVILTTHLNPDPDGIGAQIALEELLLGLGKEVVIANHDPIPHRFSFLEFASPAFFQNDVTEEIADGADLIVVVDTAELSRIGRAARVLGRMKGRVAVLDHHLQGNIKGEAVVVDPEYSSASEIVYRLLSLMGFPFTQRTVDALYAGLLFDTHGFRYVANRSEPFKVGGHLVDMGADALRIQEQLFAAVSPGHVSALSVAIRRAEYEFDRRWAWSFITSDELEEFGGTAEDAGDIAPFLVSIEGVEIATFLRQVGKRRYKLSVRSSTDYPIGHICAMFGGGGHANAGGATVKGTPEEIVNTLREEIARIFG